jgi:hypothetical protein
MNIKNLNYYCKNCGKRINYRTALYSYGLCRSCVKLGKRHPKYNPEKHKQYFCECGKEIKYGSKHCYSCSQKNKITQMGGFKGKNNPNYKHGKRNSKRKCLDCNKLVSEYYDTLRCQECFGKWECGENSPSYIHGNGYLPYPKEFRHIRKEIIERDNFKCQNCTMTQEEHYKKWNRDIEIHHIDYNKLNCERTNLITLCKKCNDKANQDRDYYYALYTYKMEDLCD